MTELAVHGNTFLALIRGRPYIGAVAGSSVTDKPRVTLEPLVIPATIAQPLVAVFHGPNSQGLLDADRTLYLRGDNRAGQLGLPDDYYPTFQRLRFPAAVNHVRMDYGHVVVALVDGSAYISDPAIRSYHRLAIPGRVVDIAVNRDGSYYLTHDGRLYALFRQDDAWLELFELALQERPRRIYGVDHSFFFIAQDGAVFLSPTFPTSDFAQVVTPTPVQALALGGPVNGANNRFIAALSEDGILYTASSEYQDLSFHQVELDTDVQEVAGDGRWLLYKTVDEQLFLKEL